MDFEQFDQFLEYGVFRQFTADDGQTYVGVMPKEPYYERKIDKIVDTLIESGEEYPILLAKFMKTAQKFTPLYQQKVAEAFNILETHSPEEISRLSPHKRLGILEKIIPTQPTLQDIEKLKPHADKVGQLMFGLKFPKQFLKDE